MSKNFFIYFSFFLAILFTFIIKSLTLKLGEDYEKTQKNNKLTYTNEDVNIKEYLDNLNDQIIQSFKRHQKNIHGQKLFLTSKSDNLKKREAKNKIKNIRLSSKNIHSPSENINDFVFEENNFAYLESFEDLRLLGKKYKKEHAKNILKNNTENPCKSINVQILTEINEEESIIKNPQNFNQGDSIGNNNVVFMTKEAAFTYVLGSKTRDLLSDNIKNILALNRSVKLKLELSIQKKEWDDFGNTISTFFITNCLNNYVEKFRNFSFEEYKKACVLDLVNYDVIDKKKSNLLLTTLSIKNFRLKVLSLFIKDEIIRDFENSLIFKEFKKLYLSIYFTSCINKLGENSSTKGYKYGFEVAICMNSIQEKLIYEINHLKSKELITIEPKDNFYFKKDYEDLLVKDKIEKIVKEKNLQLDSNLINKWLTINKIEYIFQRSFIRLIVGIPFLESRNNKVPDAVISKYFLKVCEGEFKIAKEI